MTRALVCGLLWLAMQGMAQAAELGRLFLTPADRAAIDAARHGSAEVRAAQAEAMQETPVEERAVTLEPPLEPVTVNGYIARSAGAATVWVNGRDAAPARLTPPGRDAQRVKVPLGRDGTQVTLKPGQSFDPGSRRVSDAYQQRPAAPP